MAISRKIALKQIALKPQKIRFVIFDFGNVLVVDSEKIFEDFFSLKKIEKWKRDKYEAMSHDTERGARPTKDFLQIIKKTFDLPLALNEIETMLTQTALITPMWLLLEKLRLAYTVAIFSNNQKRWPARIAHNAGINLKGIRFFNSAFIGSRKPQKYAYLYVLRYLRAKPYETVFIDDKAVNLKTAQKLGMATIHFTGSVKKITAGLKGLGVKV